MTELRFTPDAFKRLGAFYNSQAENMRDLARQKQRVEDFTEIVVESLASTGDDARIVVDAKAIYVLRRILAWLLGSQLCDNTKTIRKIVTNHAVVILNQDTFTLRLDQYNLFHTRMSVEQAKTLIQYGVTHMLPEPYSKSADDWWEQQVLVEHEKPTFNITEQYARIVAQPFVAETPVAAAHPSP